MDTRRESARRSALLAMAAAVAVWWGVAPPAHAQSGMTGDVNLDGDVNVLDVQASINMALGTAPPADEADADLNAAVDILDVQALINTTLRVGGLVQPVEGVLTDAGADVEAVAVSLDGRIVRAPVDAETGEYKLPLWVRTAWAIGFVAGDETDGRTVGTLAFPVAGAYARTLPLPEMCGGLTLNLDSIPAQAGTVGPTDLRTLLGRIGDPIELRDDNANGLPDVLDDLLEPLLTSPSILGVDLPDDLTAEALVAIFGNCLAGDSDPLNVPDLSGMESDGIPALLDSAVTCLESSIAAWIESSELPFANELVDLYNSLMLQWLYPRISGWLATLDRPELNDGNGNFVPDFIESLLCIPEIGVPCDLDADGNGLPDFAEDADLDGIPNLLDTDAAVLGDADADGVPDGTDLDDDNDGIPDYADDEPGTSQGN